MNIIFAINRNYISQLLCTIVSILENNGGNIDFYILHSDLSEDDETSFYVLNKKYSNFKLHFISVDNANIKALPVTIDYISQVTYYRYIAADLIPAEKALYLDADIVVNGSLENLYKTDIENYCCAGVRDLYIEKIGYKDKIEFSGTDLYVNAGVLLLNLKKLREIKASESLIKNTQEFGCAIEYQDQDIINITFKNKIKEIDSIYNFAAENIAVEPEKISKAVIIHYTGVRKPWLPKCKNKLAKIWNKYNKILKKISNKKIKIGLIIDEFFGGAGTAYGGYGFLARNYICKYIPDKNIQIDVLLGRGRKLFAQKYKVDNVNLYRLPKYKILSRLWLKKQNYDKYLSIELVDDYVLRMEPVKKKKLILWIQDPRPWGDWREIETVNLFREYCYYNQRIYDCVNKLYNKDGVKFLSQGYCLNDKAKDLYRLHNNVDIQYLPNPVDIDFNFDVQSYAKNNSIIYLGRIESVKRGWLFCEIAKRMPEYTFYVLGQSFREKEKNDAIMSKYKNIPNLIFAGHVDGEEKNNYIKNAKILVNTSIHEALPISFLEALAFGTLLVSNRNPENLTSKFGIWVGDVLGDGFEHIDKYVNAIKELMENENKRKQLSIEARKYVEEIHNVTNFKRNLYEVLVKEK